MITFTPRQKTLSSIVYARQKADGGVYCYFSTPNYCISLEELLDHAEANHALVKSLKSRSRSAGQFRNSLMKHASDLRIHSQNIIRRAHYIYALQQVAELGMTKPMLDAVVKQAERTYKLKT
jgi:hypothetical protein